MDKKARSPSNGVKEPSPSYRILSRPPSSEVISTISVPDLSEFETPRSTPRMLHTIGVPETTPITPPRPKSMYATPSHSQQQTQTLGKQSNAKGRRKATGTPKSGATPESGSRPKPQTPARPYATPSQAYAGPTFHASPAASALPMPKFLSKSVPEQKQGSGLKAMMERELKDAPSDQSDESPTLRKCRLDTMPLVSDESTLNASIHADQREKDKKQEESAIRATINGSNPVSPAIKTSNLAASSVSPILPGSHHSRHPDHNSIGGLFSLDSDDQISSPPIERAFHSSATSFTDNNRPNTAPSHTTATLTAEEQRKAKSLALKNLLLSPVPQRPVARLTTSDNNVPQVYRPLPNPSGLSIPVLPLSSAVTEGSMPSSGVPLLQRSPLVTSSSNGSPRHRLKSSNLRTHVNSSKPTNNVDLPEFPAIAAPSDTPKSNSYMLPAPHNHHTIMKNNSISSFQPPISSQKSYSDLDSPHLRDPIQMKSIEDYLRRVLQLDTLSSDGANGVAT